MPVRRLRGRGRLWGIAVALLATAAALLAFVSPSSRDHPKRRRRGDPAAKAATFKPAAEIRDRHIVEYWVGAVPTTWNVVPSGTDPMLGTTFDPAKTTMQTAIYRRFTADWKNQLPPVGYGLVGPIIQAQVGDTILVHFKNFDPTTRTRCTSTACTTRSPRTAPTSPASPARART